MTYPAATAFDPPRDRVTPAVGIGDVLQRTIGLMAARWPVYGGLLLVADLPFFGFGMLAALDGSAWTERINGPNGPLLSGLLTFGGLAVLMIAHVAVYVLAADEVAGRSVSLGAAFGRALRRSPSLLAIMILLWLALSIGLVLLVVPCFILLSMYAVAGPACVVEGLGPIRSLSRSAYLTKGNRWRVFGLLLLLYVAIPVVSVLISYLCRLAVGPLLAQVVNLPVGALLSAATAVAFTVLYLQLRAAREGVAVEHVARVFD
jgi:hypothetical protein